MTPDGPAVWVDDGGDWVGPPLFASGWRPDCGVSGSPSMVGRLRHDLAGG
jgi:hypothetical protein